MTSVISHQSYVGTGRVVRGTEKKKAGSITKTSFAVTWEHHVRRRVLEFRPNTSIAMSKHKFPKVMKW